MGRRVSKTVNGVVTIYLLDGDEEIAEYAGTAVSHRYITGPRIDDRIAHALGSAITTPTKTYYHTNHQGSVMAMTDNAGNVTESMSYDEYGNGTPSTGEQFGYTGRRFDPETGLYYYRARYYAPQLGRFLQVDPVGYENDLDLYAYVGNDPLNHSDATGKLPDWLVDLTGGIGDMAFNATVGLLAQTSAEELRKADGINEVNTKSAWYTAGEISGIAGTIGIGELGKILSSSSEEAAAVAPDPAPDSVVKQAPEDLKLRPGENQALDPTQLSTDKHILDADRVNTQSNLQARGTPRNEGPVRVDTTGRVIDGNHAVRAAADAGRPVKANVVEMPGARVGSSRVVDVPVVGGP